MAYNYECQVTPRMSSRRRKAKEKTTSAMITSSHFHINPKDSLGHMACKFDWRGRKKGSKAGERLAKGNEARDKASESVHTKYPATPALLRLSTPFSISTSLSCPLLHLIGPGPLCLAHGPLKMRALRCQPYGQRAWLDSLPLGPTNPNMLAMNSDRRAL